MRRFLYLLVTGTLMLAPAAAAAAQCNDGIDNDGNGYTDYPLDTGCSNLDDNTERTENIVIVLSLTDGRIEAQRGDVLSYTVTASNLGTDPFTGNLDVTISSLAVFHDIPAEAAQLDARVARWSGFSLLPGQTKTVNFSAQVINRIPADGAVTAVSRLGGGQAFDSTLVYRPAPRFVSSSSRSSSSRRSLASVSSSSMSPAELSRLFDVSANATEVLPGDRVRFDVIVRNTLDHPMQNPVVAVMFDPAVFTFSGDAFATADPDRMVWIPVEIRPGQTWSESFTLTAVSDADPGANTVTMMLEADDLSAVPLGYRTGNLPVNVLTKLPETGIGLDAILLTLSGVGVSTLGSSLVRRRWPIN